MDKQKAGRRGALGKGIGSLLGGIDVDDGGVKKDNKLVGGSASKESFTQLTEIPLTLIDPNPQQPRRIFKEQDLKELTASIKIDGVIQPILVKKSDKKGRYILIAGERRLKASKKAGLEKVPVVIREVPENDMLRVALIENIQRADLNVIEEGKAYQALIADYGLTQEKCAETVGKDRSTVANTMRILNLPLEAQNDLVDKKLTMGHARALLSLVDKKLILRAKDIVIKKSLSVRQTEKLCKEMLTEPKRKEPTPKNSDLNYIAENLRSHLKTKVKLSGSGSKGNIEISYFSAAELERVLSLIGKKLP